MKNPTEERKVNQTLLIANIAPQDIVFYATFHGVYRCRALFHDESTTSTLHEDWWRIEYLDTKNVSIGHTAPVDCLYHDKRDALRDVIKIAQDELFDLNRKVEYAERLIKKSNKEIGLIDAQEADKDEH